MKILMLSADAQMIDRRIIQEARTLASVGHSVTILSGFECEERDAYEDESGVIVKRYRYPWTDLRREKFLKKWGPRFPVRWVGWPLRRLAYRLSDGPNAFEAFVLEKALGHSFDVVHIHDFPMLRIGVLAARARGVPAIYDSHEFYPVQSDFPLDVQKRYLHIERTYVRKCAAVITVNPYIARMIAHAHGIPVPEVVLNAALPLDVEPRRLRQELGWTDGDLILVYQGWVAANRNIDTIIRALVHMPSKVKFLLIGYGDHVKDLKILAETLGVSSRVVFYGRVESEELPAVTAACDIGIIPYAAVDEMHRYCSPNKLFEFIVAQVPIVANDLPYLRDVIAGHGIGVLADLTSPSVLGAAVAELANDPEKRRDLRKALARTSEELNWNTEGRKLLAVYERLFPGQIICSGAAPPLP